MMSKITRDQVVSEALAMLDEAGLAAISTRALARRLGVEQPALYWHFKNKGELLSAMAEAAMRPHAQHPLPTPSADWREWFVANARSLRRTLLAHRDGARLHAGSRPFGADATRVIDKIAFLVACGFREHDATMALLAAGRYTLGCVLEEQADEVEIAVAGQHPPCHKGKLTAPGHALAFEAGLDMIASGLARIRVDTAFMVPGNPVSE